MNIHLASLYDIHCIWVNDCSPLRTWSHHAIIVQLVAVRLVHYSCPTRIDFYRQYSLQLHRVICKCSRSTGMCITIQILETHMHWSCLTKFAPIGRWQPLHHGTITCMQCMWGIQQLLLLLLFLFLPPYLLLFPWPCVVDCVDQGTAAATM